MCKTNQNNGFKARRLLKMWTTTLGVVAGGLLSSLPVSQSLAACLTCPQNATDTASGSAFAVHVTRGGVDRTLGEGASVGACETLRLQSLVQYAPVGTSGGVGSGFTGGTGAVFIIARGSTTGIKEFLGNVTPADMGSTLVTVTNPLVNPNLCIPPAGTVAVEAKAMLTNVYNLTTADINAGSIRFRFEYTGTSLLQDPVTGQCLDTTDQAQEKTVRIAPLPKCTITPPAKLCPGSCEDIAVTVIGQGPISINLTGPGVNVTSNNIGTAGVLSTNTVIFPNIACAPASGLTNSYTAALTDFAGCAGSCSTTLAGTPLPTCTITPPVKLCPGSTTTITATAADGTPPLNISLVGPGVNTNCVNCTSLSVTVTAPASNLTNTYTATITDSSLGSTAPNTCVCTKTTTVAGTPLPTCTITPPVKLCPGSTTTITATAADGTPPLNISLVGPGVNTNCVNCTSLSVNVTAPGANLTNNYTATITDSSAGSTAATTCSCTKSTSVAGTPIPTCTITPPATLCPGSTRTITVTGSGGTAPLFITIKKNGTIVAGPTQTGSLSFDTTAPGAGLTDTYTGHVSDSSTGSTSGTTCVCDNSTTITGSPIPLCAISPSSDITLLNGTCTNVTFSASGGTAPLSITIKKNGTTIFGPAVTNSVTLNLCASTTAAVTDTYTEHVTDSSSGSTSGTTCVADCQIKISSVGHPQIKVYKQVVCDTSAGCEAFDSPFLNTQKAATGAKLTNGVVVCPTFCYQISVTNQGTVPLTGLTVTDLSSPGPNILPSATCSFPSTLPVGGFFSCIVTNIERCDNDMNIVTASAQGINEFGTNQTVTATDTNNVTVVPINVQCTLSVSTNGPNGNFFVPSGCATQQIALSSSYCVRITVLNNGGYDLQNVTVRDELGTFGNCFSSPLNLGNLPIGGTATQTCCNLPCGTLGVPTNFKIAVKADVSQQNTHICAFDRFGKQIEATNECTTCVVCLGAPCINVFKQVACFLGTNVTADFFPVDQIGAGEHCGPFGYMATGVQATNAAGDTLVPAFCYQIIVTNCGDLDLTNVTVTDTMFGDLTSDFFASPTTVFPAHTATPVFYFKTELPATNDNQLTVYTNTVTAAGNAVPTGQHVSASTNAVAQVVPAGVVCHKYYTVDGVEYPNDCSLSITDGAPHEIVWYVGVTNVGLATLLNIHITDINQDLPCIVNMALPGQRSCLTNGESVVVAICTNAFICTNSSSGYQNTVTVTADEFTLGACTNALLCHEQINGQPVVASTTCEACLKCSAPPVCRVTGGGRQDAPESVCPQDVRYVTHGGQVGAPVGNKVCSIDTSLPNYWLGNPCIHGRWTHVRHVKGGLEGNFHARFFDTLDCACLDTNFLSPDTCQYGPATVVNGVCGNRNVGPEPRKAPANKIAFTGVGDWACPNGRREGRACLFRVDIEDRGEPGNAHALASNGKQGRVPDRYRIRIWVLSDAELAQLNSGSGADPYLLNFRNCISACNGIDFQDGTCQARACAADSCTEGGPATPTITFGNATCGVRLPNIDDGGEMLHGNHQIHPSIKDCDPANPTGPGLAKP